MQREQNVFSSTDYAIVRSAVKRLPGLLSEVVALRFWGLKTIDEIAYDLGVTVKTVDQALEKSFRILREECLRHPAFSRSLYDAIKNMTSGLAA